MKMETYLLYSLQGFDKYDKATDTYFNVVAVSLIAVNEIDAMNRVKKTMNKKGWRITGVMEYLRSNA